MRTAFIIVFSAIPLIILTIFLINEDNLISKEFPEELKEEKIQTKPDSLDIKEEKIAFEALLKVETEFLDLLDIVLESPIVSVDVFYNKMHRGIKLFTQARNLQMMDKTAEYKKKLSELQKKAFPILRKKYTDDLRKKFWIEDIEVNSMNQVHDRIRFVGSQFSLNREKKEFQDALLPQFKKLRYKRSEYLWYKYDSSYTYFQIKSPEDDEVIME